MTLPTNILFDSLSRVFPDPYYQVLWLISPHPDFDLKTPASIILESDEGLLRVINYLRYCAERGA